MFENQDSEMLPDMPVEKRERVLNERIKKRVLMIRDSNKNHLMKFYEDRSIFYSRLWQVLKTLDEKGKL